MSEILLSFVFGIFGGIVGSALVSGIVIYKAKKKLKNSPLGMI